MKKILSIIFAMMFLLVPFAAFADTENYSEENGMPLYYLNDCPVHGTVNVDEFQQMKSNNDTLLVWTPYNYDESGNTKYEVVLLLHGGGGTLNDWMNGLQTVYANGNYQTVRLFNVYDWMSYEKACNLCCLSLGP